MPQNKIARSNGNGFKPRYIGDGPHCFRQEITCLSCGATFTGEGNSPEEALSSCTNWAERHGGECPQAQG